MIKIQNYYSEDPGKVPSKDNLDVGQLWINIKDKKIGTKDSKNVIQQWSQFDPAEKQQALNSIPKTGNIADITMSNAAKQSTGNTININDDSNVVVAHTLENGTTTITIEKTTGFKATQLVLSKPEGITAQISWVGVDHWLSTVDVPVFGKDAAAQELSVAIFSSPTSVAVNVIYNTETPIDSDITEAKWGNITGNLIDQSDLQAALSLKANASDIPDTSDVLTKTEASTTYLGISAKAASASQADTAVKATQDADGNTITQTYATKSELDQKQPIGSYVNKPEYDAFVTQYSKDKATFAIASDVTEQLAAKANTADVTKQLAGKANTQHTHEIANVVGLQDALNEKATVSSVTQGLNTKLNIDTYTADKATFALKSDITSVYRYKGSVKDINSLPAEKQIGDVYNLEDSGDNVAWDGKSWDYLGSVANLGEFAKKTDLESSITNAKAELNSEIGKEVTARQQAVTKLESTKISTKAIKSTDPMYVDYANTSNHAAGGYGLKDTKYGQAGGSVSGGFSVSDSTTNVTSALGIAVNTDGTGETGMYFSNNKGEATNVRVLHDKIVFTQKNVQTNLSDLAKTADVNTALNGKLDATANAVSATKATQDASGNVITATYATKTALNAKQDTATAFKQTDADKLYLAKAGKAVSATSADSATKATQDASGNVITSTYATKDELSTKLDASDAFTRATADTLYLGKTAKAASAATADTATSATSAVNATKATQDASGNVITTTYATKSEVNTGLAGKANSSHTHTIANVTGLQDALNAASTQASNAIPKEGDRGILSGYEQFYDSPTDIDKTAPDTMVLAIGDVVNVLNAEDNIVWTKTIHMTQGSVTLGSGWVWVGGTAPTLKFPGLLILHNSNGIGIANFITGAS